MAKSKKLTPNPAYENAPYELALIDESGNRIINESETMVAMGITLTRFAFIRGKIRKVHSHILKK